MLPDSIVVFLFDDLHLNAEELARSRQAAAPVLGDAVSGSKMAAVASLSGAVNSGLTRDLTKLQAALQSLQPKPIYRANATACGNIDYYQADLIENKHDAVALQDALKRFALCNPAVQLSHGDLAMAQGQVESASRRALSLGGEDVRVTDANLAEFVLLISGRRVLRGRPRDLPSSGREPGATFQLVCARSAFRRHRLSRPIHFCALSP